MMHSISTHLNLFSVDSGETLVVRTCSVDSSTLTSDTEISRIDHSCGVFDFVANSTWEHHPSLVSRWGI